MRRTGTCAVALLGVSLVLTACGPTEAETDDTLTIGFSQRRLAGSDWWVTLMDGAEAKADELGVELVVTDAGGDTVKQNSDMEILLTKGADALMLNPQDPTGVVSGVNAAWRDDVPLITVNSNISAELAERQFCYVAEDQTQVAAQMGAQIAREAKQRWGDEPVTAVVVGGYSGETVTTLRHDGVVDGYASVEDAPEIEYLPVRYGEWLPDRALDPVRDVATANPDIDIVFNLSDVMLPGVKQGLADAGILDQVLIGTYDGQMAVLKEMMENPDGPVQADASNEPYRQGELAVEMAVAAARGKSQDEVCPGGENFVDTFLATPENASKLYDPDRQF